MRPLLFFVTAVSVLTVMAASTDTQSQAWQLERSGDSAAALELLQKNAQAPGASAADVIAWAEFLDRHHDPEARAAWRKALTIADGTEKREATRRLAILDLLAGDAKSAQEDIAAYRAAGGQDLNLPEAGGQRTAQNSPLTAIPGPLSSFSRMAALSPDTPRDEIVPALARNVVTNGYQAANSNEALEQTEYLKLVFRYLSQARELASLADKDGVLRIKTCDSTKTADLLRVLGYRVRGACGSDLVLETLNATRAFLTIDSGFPLATLEQDLRTNRPFEYDYRPTQVPVLYGPDYWTGVRDRQNTSPDFIDFLMGDPSLCRLYLALAKLEPSTAEQIRKAIPAQKLRLYAHVLDFYGSMFQIRDGHAVVPGGERSRKMWGDLAGANPDNGPNFFFHLLAKDDGWLASYFDALMRISGPVQDYLTEPARMQRFYLAIRGKVTSPGPARPVFRANSDMLLLTTRLRVENDGRPFIPGGVDVWRGLFMHHARGKYDAKLSREAVAWKDGDDVLEALFGLCRKNVENEPLRIFMALSDIDHNRSQRLDPATVDILVRNWHELGQQYAVLAENPELSAATIRQFVDTANATTRIGDLEARADIAGSLQALVGLWQIFVRNGSLPVADADHALNSIVAGFAAVKDERALFDASRAGVTVLLTATHSASAVSAQDRMIDLLAGSSRESDVRTEMVEQSIRLFEAQRLISLSDLFALSDSLNALSRGQKADAAVVNKAAGRIADIQLPQASLSPAERNTLAFGYWTEKHIDRERKLNLRGAIERAGSDPKKIEEVRAALGPMLRDTLVGFNYIYYAPPGAQIMETNPVFVRSHDFIGVTGNNETWKATDVQGGGWPTSAGGKLIGSLAQLPYALAQAEQNFLIPSREQALIWGDLVPELLASATVPRWWNATSAQLHWISLHLDYGETLFAEASMNPSRMSLVETSLSRYAAPARVAHVLDVLSQGNVRLAVAEVTPSELFDVAHDVAFSDAGAQDPLGRDIVSLAKESPDQLNYEAIGKLFGTPKPTLANSFGPQLLHLRTFPALMGYSSRILAESWESNLLYYAAIADRMHLQPAELNLMIPSWTEETVEHIFATHLEDWPALLRSLRATGEDALQKSRRQAAMGGGD